MAPNIEEDYYEILEISETADKGAIKASYRRLARIRHPDKNPYNLNATAEFQLVRRSSQCKPPYSLTLHSLPFCTPLSSLPPMIPCPTMRSAANTTATIIRASASDADRGKLRHTVKAPQHPRRPRR